MINFGIRDIDTIDAIDSIDASIDIVNNGNVTITI